jgi:uncharacterized protein
MGFRPEAFEQIEANVSRLDVLEVTVEHYIHGSRRVRAMIEDLSKRLPVVAHGVTLSLGTAVLPDRAFLREVAAFLRLVGAPWYSEHLAFTKTPSQDTSQLLPLVRTTEMLEVVRENLAVVQDALRVPVLLENVAYYFEYPSSTMSELDFMLGVLDASDCLLLMDLENLRINAANHGYDAAALLRRLPPGKVEAVHLAGGVVRKGLQLDSHDRPVSRGTLALLEELLRSQRPATIVIERDSDLGDLREVLDDVSRVRAVVEAARAS